jgi:hypothetical protein
MTQWTITNVAEAIDATLEFYGVSAAQAALGRQDVMLTGIPAPLAAIYNRLGGLLEESLRLGGYGPLRAGCFDLEFPFTTPLGLMVMSDSQNGPMMRLSGDGLRIECVGLGTEYQWSEPLEPFLTSWLLGDWVYRLRWQLTFPSDGSGEATFERLMATARPLLHSHIASSDLYELRGGIIATLEKRGRDQAQNHYGFGCFRQPSELPFGAILKASDVWLSEPLEKWLEAVRGRAAH